MEGTISIRFAQTSDGPALVRLAELDSARMPRGELLLGEVDGVLRAAISLDGRESIADPFARTADVVALLRAHAARMRSPRARRALLSPWRPSHELAPQR
jgi:hypothetical protein